MDWVDEVYAHMGFLQRLWWKHVYGGCWLEFLWRTENAWLWLRDSPVNRWEGDELVGLYTARTGRLIEDYRETGDQP